MENRHRRLLRWGIIALLATAVLAIALRPLAREARRKWRQRRAEAFTEQGYAAWQQGRLREAEVALDSAVELDPGSARPWLLHARLLLQSGDTAGAARIYGRLLGTLPTEAHGTIAANFHDALVGTANWGLLVRIALDRIAADPASRPVWTAAALESARLAPADIAREPAIRKAVEGLPAVPAALLSARLKLRLGDDAGARETLGRLPGPLDAAEARMAARLFREAGDPAAGRARALRVGHRLPPAELALVQILSAVEEPAAAASAAATLCAGARDPLHQAGPLLDGLSLALPVAHPRVAEAFDRGLEPLEARLIPPVISAVWLLNDLAGRTEAAARWRERARARHGLAALPQSVTPFTPNVFLLLTGYLQMPRTLVYGLISTLPAPTAPTANGR